MIKQLVFLPRDALQIAKYMIKRFSVRSNSVVITPNIPPKFRQDHHWRWR